jgi:heavy metal sensor kinase
MENEELKLILGADLDAVTAGMRRVGNAFLLVLPAALLLIAAGSWWLAQRALRPVLDLTRTVERVTAKGLDQRVAGQDADAEFRQLIAMFNQMMDRLERSFQQATRFSADAAHELKTPLTILQGRLEQALQRAPAGSDEQRTYGALAEEVQRLKVLVQRLLLLARADSGQLVLHLEAIDLTGIVEELGADVAVLAPHLKVEKEIAPQAMVLADAALLTQLLRNLTDNAVKYNVAKGQVRFHLRTDAGQARFTLANTGQTIPPEARERIFDRFYRGNAAHSRETDGVGLGLSLAREIARAHHGDLVLDPTEPGLISFTLTLPGAAKHS